MSVITGSVGQRTGTDDMPYIAQPIGGSAAASSMPAPAAVAMGTAFANDFADKKTPSVWRTGRNAASARVDAMSSSGMEDLEIPAFLRKQAD